MVSFNDLNEDLVSGVLLYGNLYDDFSRRRVSSRFDRIIAKKLEKKKSIYVTAVVVHLPSTVTFFHLDDVLFLAMNVIKIRFESHMKYMYRRSLMCLLRLADEPCKRIFTIDGAKFKHVKTFLKMINRLEVTGEVIERFTFNYSCGSLHKFKLRQFGNGICVKYAIRYWEPGTNERNITQAHRIEYVGINVKSFDDITFDFRLSHIKSVGLRFDAVNAPCVNVFNYQGEKVVVDSLEYTRSSYLTSLSLSLAAHPQVTRLKIHHPICIDALDYLMKCDLRNVETLVLYHIDTFDNDETCNLMLRAGVATVYSDHFEAVKFLETLDQVTLIIIVALCVKHKPILPSGHRKRIIFKHPLKLPRPNMKVMEPDCFRKKL